jgi:hypothetical protein
MYEVLGSIAWYLEQAPGTPPPRRDALLRAIRQLESELARTRKLLGPNSEPYR